MTQTPNVGLKKIDGSENWRNVFDYYNYSMDQADEAIAAARGGLTYVENGDTIAANANYTEGRFICWKGEIYRIKTTINATVTSANWTTYLTKQDGIGGALSQINEDLTSLNSKFAWKLIGSVTGDDNYINIPSDFNELMLVARIAGGGNAQSVVIPKAEFVRESSWWRSGGYTTLNTPVLVTFFTNMSQASFVHASLASTDYSSTTVLYAYYR